MSDDELRKSLLSQVKEVIESLDDPDDPSKDYIFDVDSGGEVRLREIERFEPTVFSQIGLGNEDCLKIVEWLLENADYPYLDTVTEHELLDLMDYMFGEIPSEEELDTRIHFQYCNVVGLLGRMANVTGKVAYQENIARKLVEDFLRYNTDEKLEYQIISPLLSFKSEKDIIEFPVELFDTNTDYFEYDILEANIREKNPFDLAAIYNFENGKTLRGFGGADDFSHLVEITTLGYPTDISERQILKSIGVSLRLFDPSATGAIVGPAYVIQYGWLDERFDIPFISGSSPSEFVPDPPYTDRAQGMMEIGEYQLAESEVDAFIEFWSKYCNIANYNQETIFSQALNRFDGMYSNILPEDKTLNAAIGVEGTLLKDLGTQSSYTFRMILRSGILLEDSIELTRTTIHDFFRILYYVRSEVVHKDGTVESALRNVSINNEVIPNDPMEFSIFTRRVFGALLIRYMDFYLDDEMSITEVNQQVDRVGLGIEQ